MARAEFRVGVSEVHSLRVDVSRLTENVRVWIDEIELPADKIFTTGAVTDFQIPSIGFDVGDVERHRVEVKLKGGVLSPGMEVRVDGKPHTFDG